MSIQRRAGNWGRAWTASLLARISTLALIVVAPLLVFYFYLSCVSYGGALSGPIVAVATGTATLGTLWNQLPDLTWAAVGIAAVWLGFQVVLALWVPDILHKFLPGYRGGKRLGAVTPAGEKLSYQINGLQVWLISHVAFGLGGYAFGWWSPTIIADNWGSLLWVANIAGMALGLFAFAKARLFPTSVAGRKFSGSVIYDFFMGIEHNPRIGKFDFKLFFNGRPGIIAWTMINWSFAAYQWVHYGHVTNSMILVNLLQAIYVLDFFWNESWYLNTIDIAHDHFGWMLAWGDSVWLPWMYTLQAFYLAYNPVILSTPYALFVLILGLGAYALMRWANAQKDLFRRTGGDCKIWGKQAEKIEASYTSGDGKVHKSNLMVAGWWRIARHTNYLGDLLGSLAYCLACGFYNVLPYFYLVYMTILLVHRSLRDEHRCHHKYGAAWEEYCRRVPYRIIPGIF